VIQLLDTDEGGSRLLAVKVSTGEKVWETPRPFFTAGWSTPAICRGRGGEAIVVLGSKKVAAYETSKGAELWSLAGFPFETVPGITFGDGLIFACAAGMGGRSSPPFEGTRWTDLLKLDANKDGKLQKSEIPKGYELVLRPELPEGHPGRRLPWAFDSMFDGLDKDKNGELTEEEWTSSMAEFSSMDTPVIVALRPEARTTTTNEEQRIAWKRTRGIPEIPTPLFYDHKLFVVRDGGLLQCLEAASGKVLYEERLGVAGGYVASPIAAAGRVYIASNSGTIIVIDGRAKELKVLARNVLGEKITATPALAEKAMYVRTDQHLFSFAGRK
jgi:outer membrane protein assembly factor BamB